MQEILIIGKATEEIANIKTMLGEEFPNYRIRFTKPDRHSILHHLNDQTQLAILNYGELPKDFSQSAEAVRKMGYRSPMLVLASHADQGQVREIQHEKDVSWLAKPYTKNDLTFVSNKMLCGDTIHQRYHPRYAVNEVVSFESFGISGMAAADMVKISKGGALLRIQGHQRVETGDIIQVHVQLRNLAKYHRMPAHVVYCELGDEAVSGETFGVQWIAPNARKKIA